MTHAPSIHRADRRRTARARPVTAPAAGAPLWRPDSVLVQAQALLQDAREQPRAADRFRIAHLAALRATAALLAVRTGPTERAARRRPTSAWVLLESTAPEFAEWSAYFAAGASQRAAADAGAVGAVSDADAEELLEAVATFLALVSAAVQGDTLLGLPSPQLVAAAS